MLVTRLLLVTSLLLVTRVLLVTQPPRRQMRPARNASDNNLTTPRLGHRTPLSLLLVTNP